MQRINGLTSEVYRINFLTWLFAGKLHIIDYEYGSQGYRGYDIANFFNEHAGFECDYSL